MRPSAAALLAGLALAGCGPADQGQPEDEATTETAQEDARQPPLAEQGTIPEASEAGQARNLPPADGRLRFVGRWAASTANCASLAWRFTERKLETPAGSVCTFDRVTPVGGGYDIESTCTAEGPARQDLLKIRFAESAQAMLFESQSIADTGLVYCGSTG